MCRNVYVLAYVWSWHGVLDFVPHTSRHTPVDAEQESELSKSANLPRTLERLLVCSVLQLKTLNKDNVNERK